MSLIGGPLEIALQHVRPFVIIICFAIYTPHRIEGERSYSAQGRSSELN